VKATTPLDPVTWDAELAKYAQEWTDMTCENPQHRMRPSLNGKPLGENLYASIGADTMPGKQAVEGWSAEVACYTFGAFATTDKCDLQCAKDKYHSDGCGHYTQVVWRASTKIGCGVTTCGGTGFNMHTEVICNYAPAGNFMGQNPY
jgi:hypothetical protein